MIKEALCVIFAACVLRRIETVEVKKLPNLLLVDDTSREILFLDLYKRLSALEARTQMSDAVDWTQQTQFDTLKTLAENQQKWLKDLEALVTPNDRCGKPLPSKQAAFSAYLKDIQFEVNETGAIVFNQVIINEGGYYNPETGIFTCPWDGVYDFSFFIGQRGGETATGAWAALRVNNEGKIMAVVDAYHNKQDLQGGNRMIIRLIAGDIVKVITYAGAQVNNSDPSYQEDWRMLNNTLTLKAPNKNCSRRHFIFFTFIFRRT